MKFYKLAKKYGAPVIVASSAMAANAAFAIDQTTVDTAISTGTIVVTAVVAGVITVAALAFGLNMVKGLISK